MVILLKQEGTTNVEDVCEDICELLCTVLEYTARNVVRSCILVILERDLLTLAEDRDSTWSSGASGVFCAGVLLLASKPSEEAVQTVQSSDVVVTGLGSRLIARDGLYPLPQAPCVSAVSKVVHNPAAVLLLC